MSIESKHDRIANEAAFQDERMRQALEGKEEFRDRFYFVNRRALQTYEDMHKGLKGKRVVVVGSSDGGVTPLARQGVYVEGTDISAVSLEKLQRSIEKEGLSEFATTRVMDAENMDYPEGSLDVVTCSGVLHHIDTEKALRSWARCIKANDGAVLMFEPLAMHPLAAIFRVFTPSMRTPDEHPLRGRDFKIMHKYYESVERMDFGLFTPVCAAIAVVPGLHKFAEWTLPFFEGLDNITLKLFPFVRNFCWLTVVRLKKPRR